MGRCDVCGNEYDGTFKIKKGDKEYTFDTFECASNLLAPTCNNCGVRIIGHGLESEDKYYCSHHCMELIEGSQSKDVRIIR